MMNKLREIRLQVVVFINRFEAYLIPAGKFIFAMIVFCTINSQFGYMTKIAKLPLAVILSLFCSFMPLSIITVIGAGLTLLHAYAISMEFAIVLGVVYLIMFLLFFRFSPKDHIAVLLTPLCFVFKIPYTIPMSFGLVGSPTSAISVACGTIVFYVLKYMVSAQKAFDESGVEDLLDRLRALLEGLLKNKEMLICAFAFALTVLVVYIVRRLSINYAWTIAMIVGALTGILIILVGDVMYNTNISIVGLIIGTILACGVVKVIQFLVFDVDYSRTEKVQFEDDDYYYYVKAVPKITAGTIKDSSEEGSKRRAKKQVSKHSVEERAARVMQSDASEREDEEEERTARKPARESGKEAPAGKGTRRSSSNSYEDEFAREKAAYEARQAEIARRREAQRRREERMRNAESSQRENDTIVQEEDSDLGLSRRMAYQRRKLEERLTKDQDK
ncbi:MAG: hypothetical protein K5776_09335 [Lachnospiraceae bacterium]|nr:hypothetical protein [Lachnospiraceae bacterium]